MAYKAESTLPLSGTPTSQGTTHTGTVTPKGTPKTAIDRAGGYTHRECNEDSAEPCGYGRGACYRWYPARKITSLLREYVWRYNHRNENDNVKVKRIIKLLEHEI